MALVRKDFRGKLSPMAGTTTPNSHGTLWTVLAGGLCGFFCLLAWFVFQDRELTKDIFGGLFSVVTTPFFMETTIFFLGLALVVVWNSWRQKKDGDGWVFLAEDEPRERSGQAPGRHDAVFPSPPETPPQHLDLTVIEGLLELGAWSEAGEELLALSEEERESEAGLLCRLRLARGLGQTQQADALAARLAAMG